MIFTKPQRKEVFTYIINLKKSRNLQLCREAKLETTVAMVQ